MFHIFEVILFIYVSVQHSLECNEDIEEAEQDPEELQTLSGKRKISDDDSPKKKKKREEETLLYGSFETQNDLEKEIQDWGVQRYNMYCCFIVKLSRWHFLKKEFCNHLKEMFVLGLLKVFDQGAGYLYVCCPSEKGPARRNINQFVKYCSKACNTFNNNVVYIKGNTIFVPEITEFFKAEGDLLFYTCEPEKVLELDIISAVNFCIAQNIYDAKRLARLYKSLAEGNEISPDRRNKVTYCRAACLAQRDNALATFKRAKPNETCSTICKMAYEAEIDKFLKRSCAEILLEALDKHKECCIKPFGFENELSEPGVIEFLEYQQIDVNYFFSIVFNVLLHKIKERRNLIVTSWHRDIGKTTIIHAISSLFPERVVGCVNFSKWSRTSNSFMLHHAKGMHVCCNDDVTKIDFLELDENCDLLDGIFRKSGNSKFGTMDLVKICPQMFTSNDSLSSNPRLQTRIIEFELPRNKSIVDYCEFKDMTCGIVNGLLNYMAFDKLKLKKGIVDTHVDRKPHHKKQSDFKDSDFHDFSLAFEEHPTMNQKDRFTLTIQGESLTYTRN